MGWCNRGKEGKEEGKASKEGMEAIPPRLAPRRAGHYLVPPLTVSLTATPTPTHQDDTYQNSRPPRDRLPLAGPVVPEG
jgi:hypothetical protein